MVNTNMLKGKLTEHGMNVEMMAKHLEMDTSTLYRRISNSETFTIGEADKISRILGLSKDEVGAIFFSQYVA